MNEEDPKELRAEAIEAHRLGFADEATKLFLQILRHHPHSPEAADALYYMTSGRRLPPQRANGNGPLEETPAARAQASRKD